MRRKLRPVTVFAGIGLIAAGFASSAIADPGVYTVGDARVAVELATRGDAVQEIAFNVAGQSFAGLAASPASAKIDGRQTQPRFSLADKNPADRLATSAILTAEDDLAKWELEYRLTGPGRITKTLTILPRKALHLEQVVLWESAGPASGTVARTSLQDIAAFLRSGDRGLFASLDFPYSRIESQNGRTSISYPPYLELKPGDRHVCHSLTFGAVALTHRSRYGFDDGEVDAMDAYVQERFAPRFERPMFTSASIVNRYTQPAGDIIFYSMRDHPTLCTHTDLLERELALMPKLGVEYYQVFPGVFDWGPDDPRPSEVQRLMDVARRNGVRMGDYSGASSVFCPHYNEHRNHLDKPEWLIRSPNGNPAGGFCFGNPAFVDWYINTVVPTCKRFGFEVHTLDFLGISPCHAADHGHPAGQDGVYHQVAGLVRLLEAINAVSPQMMTWSNSGNWSEFLPKLAWSNPNLYLTDPFIATPWQGLNMTRLLDDARREQMVALHNARFIPYRFLTNCQYFFSQNSVSPDIRNFEYGALSTLAVTPNLCLAEIRPWLDRLNDADRDRVIRFYGHWTSLIRDNFTLWKKTYNAGESPGPGAVEIYSHADGDHGFVFAVNPQYWDRTVEIPLDETLGFHGQGRCEVKELYPQERLRLTPQGPTVALGSRWALTIPAQQVLVLQIGPAPERLDAPRLYGLPGTVEVDGKGYLVKTHGQQGHSGRFAVALPGGALPIRSAEIRPDVPLQPMRLRAETPLRLLSSEASLATFEITFRRTPAPTELRDWTVRPGDLTEETKAGLAQGWTGGDPLRFPLFVDVKDVGVTLPITDARAAELRLGPLANFCGGYIENAFQEEQETYISLGTDGPLATQPASASRIDSPPEPRPMPPEARDVRPGWWLQTRFHLPFMYTMGAEPAPDEHTLLILPLVRQDKCKSIHAWINGAPLEVRAYRYPRNRSLACYYADLVGSGAHSGDNVLVVHVQY